MIPSAQYLHFYDNGDAVIGSRDKHLSKCQLIPLPGAIEKLSITVEKINATDANVELTFHSSTEYFTTENVKRKYSRIPVKDYQGIHTYTNLNPLQLKLSVCDASGTTLASRTVIQLAIPKDAGNPPVLMNEDGTLSITQEVKPSYMRIPKVQMFHAYSGKEMSSLIGFPQDAEQCLISTRGEILPVRLYLMLTKTTKEAGKIFPGIVVHIEYAKDSYPQYKLKYQEVITYHNFFPETQNLSVFSSENASLRKPGKVIKIGFPKDPLKSAEVISIDGKD